MVSFKARYHSDPYRSKFYAAQESFAKTLLESIIARNSLPYEVVSLGLTERPGIEPSYFSSVSNRFDYAIVRSYDKAIVALVEVTGDSERDNYARILTEKIVKIELWLHRRGLFPIYVMYLKRSRATGLVRSVRWFPGELLVTAYREGCESRKQCFVDTWIEGEKPYLFIDLKLGLATRSFVSVLKKLPMIIGKTIPVIKVDELRGG